jgi:hypothetical protein
MKTGNIVSLAAMIAVVVGINLVLATANASVRKIQVDSFLKK